MSATAAASSSSTLAQVLTGFLALCSALIFILLYLRPPWQHNTRNAHHSHHHTAHRHLRKPHRPSSLALEPSSRSSSSSPHEQQQHYSPLLVPVPIRPKSKQPALPKRTAPPSIPFSPLSAPVVVALTTLPSRVHHIDKCIASLKQQSYPIHRILLCLPAHSTREGCAYSIPERLQRDSMVDIVRCEHDAGPLTRLLQAMQHTSRDAYIVSVHDDVVYHPDTVLGLLRQSVAAGGSAVLGYAGYRLHGEPWVQSNVTYVRRWEERLMDDAQLIADLDADDEHVSRGPSPSPSCSPSRPHGLTAVPSSALSSHHVHGVYLSDPSLRAIPLSAPHEAALYPTEAADVLSSFRAVLYPPGALPETEVIVSAAASLPSSLFYLDDEFVCGLLSSLGVPRRVVLSPLDVCIARLKLKNGRWSGSATAAASGAAATSSSSSVQMMRRWSEVMEAMVHRGWWPEWETDYDTPMDSTRALTAGKAEEKEQVTAGKGGGIVDWRDLIVEEDPARDTDVPSIPALTAGSPKETAHDNKRHSHGFADHGKDEVERKEADADSGRSCAAK